MNDSTETTNYPTVLLTGGTGFIGRAIQQATQNDSHYRLRLLTRRIAVNTETKRDIVVGNLEDTVALRRAAESTSAVVHCAHYIGYDPVLCQRTNIDGTRNLLQAAKKAEVQKFIYISTTGVYGGRRYQGLEEDEIIPSPSSTLSVSRREAEILVLEAGGTVVRPNLVYGHGDKWVVPLWLQTLTTLNSFINEGTAKVSTIRVDKLGSVVTHLLQQPLDNIRSTIFHANDEPSTVRDILLECANKLGSPIPSQDQSISFAEAKERLRNLGIREHQLSMLWEDNWFSSERLNNLFAYKDGSGFSLNATAVEWYSKLLGLPQR